jgi:hypothetical protein
MLVIKLGFEGNNLSLFCGDGTYCCIYGDPCQNLVFVPLLTTELETFAPSWPIFNIPTHLTYVFAWEK